jgi:hypothetical protein
LPRSDREGLRYPGDRVLESPLLISMGIHDRWMLDRVRAKSPLLFSMGLADIPKRRKSQQQAELARASRVGRDTGGMVENSDLGPGLRRKDIKTSDNVLLREADVETERVNDPDRKFHEFHRARRTDALTTLFRVGTIEKREKQAGEQLRDDISIATDRISSCLREKVPSASSTRMGISDDQLRYRDRVRGAYAAIDRDDWPALMWVVEYGSVAAFALIRQVRPSTVSLSLRNSLRVLADHYDTVL